MIRNNFPKERESYEGGTSDGWCYHIDFWGENNDQVLNAVRNFLNKEGYEDIPLPLTAERLWWDYLRPKTEGKFVWHPIIIYQSVYKTNAIELHIYKENHPEHKELWDYLLSKSK